MTSYGGAMSALTCFAAYRSPRNGATSGGSSAFTIARSLPCPCAKPNNRWIGQYKEGYFPPLTNLARLTEEVGELAREVNHRFGEKTKKPEEPEGSIAMELADLLFVVICLANSQGIDLDDAFAAMMRKVTSRDADRWTRKAR